MKAINIALRRSDGKVECDTIYKDEMFTQEDIEKISEKFDCDVIVSYIGDIVFLTEEESKRYTLKYERPKIEEKKEDDTDGTSTTIENGISESAESSAV